MKKLLLTTAMTTSLLASVALAEVKIGGGLEMTFADSESATTGASAGARIGTEFELDITATGKLSNGMSIKTHAEFISDITTSAAAVTGTRPVDVGLTVGITPTIDLIIGQDEWEVMDNNPTVKAYNVIQDAANVTTVDSMGLSAFAADTANIGVRAKVAGGTFGVIYSPDTTINASSGDRTVGGGGGSAYEVGYVGSLGVEGLTVLAGVSSKTAENSSTEDTDGKAYGVAYKHGKFAASISVDDVDAPGATSTDTKGTSYGLTYAVTDAITVGLQRLETEIGGTTADEETDQLEVAYNLGAATFAASVQSTDNIAGGTRDADSFTITLKHSF
jgi:hypothetical protein